MPPTIYRLYLDDAAASREQLDSIEEITVEQEVDMASEGRLVLPICTSDKGGWSDEKTTMLTRARRARVEIKVGDGRWTPLIDGPVMRIDTAMSPDPGQSSATLVVHDDSAWLARDDELARLDDLLDHEIARKLFQSASQISSTDIEQTQGAGTGTAVAVQRGTAMDLLRKLARRNGMYAYVRAGDSPGKSVGVFRTLPTRGDGIPDLVLLGPDRNLLHWTGSSDNDHPVKAVTHSLDVFSKNTTSGQAGLGDLRLLGSDPPLVGGAQPGRKVLAPCHGASVAPQQRANAAADRASFAVDASGEVMSDCYGGVLTPYRVVTVRGVDGRQSGNYVVKKVTHSLGRSLYFQRFWLMRNARSAGANAAAVSAPPGIS